MTPTPRSSVKILVLASILGASSLLCTSRTHGQTTYDWTGAVNSNWDLGANYVSGTWAQSGTYRFGPASVTSTYFYNSYAVTGGIYLDSGLASNITINGSQPIVFASGWANSGNGTITIASNSRDLTIDNSIESAGVTTWSVGAGRTLSFTGSLSKIPWYNPDPPDAGSFAALTKQGEGTVLLSGSNTYTGPTTVSGGTLIVGGGSLAAASPLSVASGATFQTNVNNAFGGQAGNIAAWTIAGTFLTNSNGNSTTMPLSVTLNSGTMSNNGIDYGAFGNFLNAGGTTITANGAGNTISGRIAMFASSLTLNTPTAGDALTVSGVLGATLDLTNTGAMIKSGAGTLTLSAVNTYTGGTTVNEGTLSLLGSGGNGRIGGALTVNSSGTVVTTGDGTGLGFNNQLTALTINGGLVRTDGGTSHIFNITNGVSMTGGELQSNNGVSSPTGNALQWNRTALTTNASATSAVISGRVNLRADAGYSTWAVSVADGAAATDLLVSAAITQENGTVGITKSGNGTMTLSGTSTYTGATSVNAGKLLANGSLGNTSVSVASAATLGGSGSIAGTATVDGILSPGNSPGVITLGSLVLGGSSTTLIEITGTSRGSAYDGVDITTSSGLTYGGLLSLDFSGLVSAVANSTTFDIFNFAGSPSGDFSTVTSTGLYSGAWTSLGSGSFQLVSGGQTLTFSQATGDIIVVPEPSALALAAGGIAAGVAAYRRRSRNA